MAGSLPQSAPEKLLEDKRACRGGPSCCPSPPDAHPPPHFSPGIEDTGLEGLNAERIRHHSQLCL